MHYFHKKKVKFSLNLKSRQGGESQTVEFKRLTQKRTLSFAVTQQQKWMYLIYLLWNSSSPFNI